MTNDKKLKIAPPPKNKSTQDISILYNFPIPNLFITALH